MQITTRKEHSVQGRRFTVRFKIVGNPDVGIIRFGLKV